MVPLPLFDVPFSTGARFEFPVGETPMMSLDSMNLCKFKWNYSSSAMDFDSDFS